MITEIAPGIEARLSDLDNSENVLEWVMGNPERTQEFLDFYDALVKKMNMIPGEHGVLEIMPATKKIKDLLGNNTIPLTGDYKGFGGARIIHAGLTEARDPMLVGQQITTGDIASPTSKDYDYAIGTPSMDTSPDVLAFGTMGHVLERTFFNWAREKGLEPEGGWEKDMYLHAIDEIVMLHLASDSDFKPGEYPIIDYFILPNDENGLGWLNKDKVKQFEVDLWRVLTPER